MKNVQLIDGAANCAYDIFAISDDDFALLFPEPGQDIEFAEDLGTGAAQAVNNQKSWPYFVAGGASLGLSIGFALGADGKYAGAVNSYNRQLGPSGSRLNEP